MLHLGQIDRGDDKPPYRQIADLLRRPISTGHWAAGDRLPSEAALVDHFGVARMTVRQAVQQLRAEGLVVSEHGRGVFVRTTPPVRRLASDRFLSQRHHPPGTEAVPGAGKAETTSTVDRLTATRETPNPVVAQRLGLTPGDAVVVRSWRCLAAGRPVATAVSYIPATIAHTPTTEHPGDPGGIYTQLDEAGHTVARFTEEVGARMYAHSRGTAHPHSAPRRPGSHRAANRLPPRWRRRRSPRHAQSRLCLPAGVRLPDPMSRALHHRPGPIRP